MRYEAVVVGASAGGLNAFEKIFSKLSEDFSLPIFVVQHLLESDDSYLAKHLCQMTRLAAVEVVDKQPIKPGMIYVSPPGYHMLIENKQCLALSSEERVNYSRPSIDLLFSSAAKAYRDKLVGILLTGANNDGAEGLAAIKANGGAVIVQEPKTAAAPIMPQAGIDACEVDHIYALEKIANWLNSLEK